MRKVHSAGGVVIKNEKILMLRKSSGDWVLPKGRIEVNESESEAAMREVAEETGISAMIIEALGKINYQYCNIWHDNEMIDKFVSWFLMFETGGALFPQKEEGFVEARYIPVNRYEEYAKYEDEKRMIRRALTLIGER
jgi:8-oxo-dGTP pyrophosphatase MutT (NUDIX family)